MIRFFKYVVKRSEYRSFSNSISPETYLRPKEPIQSPRRMTCSNKLNNIFSRYSDNENLEGLYFRNDSHEWETKVRAKTTSYLNDWKITWGGNIQYSDYFNNTSDFYNQIQYLTKINFYKYAKFSNVSYFSLMSIIYT